MPGVPIPISTIGPELTVSDFVGFYPQFASYLDSIVLTEYVRLANLRFSDFMEDAIEARRLYTAHKMTLYCAACLPEGLDDPTAAQIASAGQGSTREIASKKVGEVAITYATGSTASGAASTDLADLSKTIYGLQLLSLINLYGRSEYIP